MKSHVTKILFVAITFFALAFGVNTEAKAEAVAPTFSVQSLAQELTSPEKIARYIFKNFPRA